MDPGVRRVRLHDAAWNADGAGSVRMAIGGDTRNVAHRTAGCSRCRHSRLVSRAPRTTRDQRFGTVHPDGLASVRKSNATLRGAARLVRADDGYVVWSETYDRPLADKLMVQDDIASEVTKALRAVIN